MIGEPGDRSIDQLRSELKNLGYLSHGLERWFAQDPWRSRTFWSELLLVTLKASVLVALFGAIPMVAVMIFRDGPLTMAETSVLAAIDFAALLVVVMVLLNAIGLLLRFRPSLAIENPRVLMGLSMGVVGLIDVGVWGWWLGFAGSATAVERVVLLLLLFLLFIAGAIVVSAALLSFSIHESRRIPSIHRKSRTLPLFLGGLVLLAAVFVPSWLRPEAGPRSPSSPVIVSPRSGRVVVVAVEGLTEELFTSQSALGQALPHQTAAAPVRGSSSAARWADIGTGTLPTAHRVRAIEGLQIAGSGRVLQSVSQLDLPLREIAPLFGLARRHPLPPSVRKRDYVWEILSGRGVPAVAVNWWASRDVDLPSLRVVSQEEIFTRAARGSAGSERATALAVDRLAAESLASLTRRETPAFATVFLPGLDIVLDRLRLDDTAKLAGSVELLRNLQQLVSGLRSDGWNILLVAVPGEGQQGQAVLATNLDLELEGASLEDVAPTVLDLYGFPSSSEMGGKSLLPGSSQTVIGTYGDREQSAAPGEADQEYYESLRSLGYIQ